MLEMRENVDLSTLSVRIGLWFMDRVVVVIFLHSGRGANDKGP